jgi:hypothetical protein
MCILHGRDLALCCIGAASTSYIWPVIAAFEGASVPIELTLRSGG